MIGTPEHDGDDARPCNHDSQAFTDEYGTHWRCLRCGEHTCIDPCIVIQCR